MTSVETYESVLADAQSELVAACLEYAGDVASDIYLFGSIESEAVYFKPFFIVDGALLKIHQVPEVDTSMPRMRALLNFGNDQLERITEAATRLGRRAPTLLKLHYSVEKGSLDTEFGYDLYYSEDGSRFVTDVFQEWQAQIAASL